MADGRLKWDQNGAREYELGVDHGVLYVMGDDGEYQDGVAWDGLIGVSQSPDGAEATDMWADNIKYGSLRSTENFKFGIEAYMAPDAFEACDGSKSIATGVYIGQQNRKPFGFSYRTTVGNDTAGLDYGEEIHIIYNATASPSERAYSTINDSPDAMTLSWDCDTIAVDVEAEGCKPTAHLVIKTHKLPEGKKTLIENKLWGKDGTGSGSTAATPPTLPTPDEIITLITGN